jgi:hypothetical protein
MTDPFDACRVAYEQGQRDAIAAAVNRVEALFLARLLHSNGFVNAIIAAIKGDQP